ncbi:MAG: hypothetical protein EOM05_10485 [Clostridia bacterium]|nr:hypothetical protein [Erysipelotrichia bacterium]NCC88269.1 hypothetical protein [Clostridia bacterium]
MKKIGILFLCLLCVSLSACGKDEEVMDTFIGTPHIFVVEEGQIVASVSPGDGSEGSGHGEYFSSKESFDRLMNQYKMVDKDQKEGEIINIHYADFVEMMDKKTSFVAIATQTTCGHCLSFKENVLDDYIKNNGIKIYEINFTLEASSDVAKAAFEEMKELVK